MPKLLTFAILVVVVASLAPIAGRGSAALASAEDDGAGLEFFEAKIRPVLVDRCYKCHSAGSKSLKGGLRLDAADAFKAGGDSGPVLVPGKVEESALIDAIAYNGEASEMPPDSRLPVGVVDDFRRWVEMGAPLPAAGGDGNGPAPAKPGATIDFDEGRRFWSFRPAGVKPLPAVSDPSWPRGRVDAFVMAGLDAHALRPSPEADRRTYLRRVSLDLLGLPPTGAELAAFLSDPAPDAYERVVETLLASPRYGERWGRYWLDVARYAEDNPTGEATNKPPRNAFAYRDWVVRTLNDDLPYDEFVRRQLAADYKPGLPLSERAALGFLGLGPVYHKEPKLSAEVIGTIVADEWDEKLDTVTRGLLGLTVACARCHDHKFDPIPTTDYYALAGVLASTQQVEQPLKETDPAAVEALASVRRQIVELDLKLGYAREMKKTAASETRDGAKYDPAIADLDARLKTLKATKLFDGPTAPAVRDAGLWVNGDDPAWTALDYKPGVARDLPVFVRGSVANPGPIVPRRFLTVLSTGEPSPFREGSGRGELAESVVGRAASLAGRVIVNRVWGWHFGRPIVATPSNFGKLGEPPTHPDLLDDLTARFVAGGWSLKGLHREIVLSAAYRQSSRHDPDAQAADPENRWLWRANRRRLDVEGWRDAILAASGTLNPAMTGPSGPLDSPENRRRTVYGEVSRRRTADVLRVFDFPDPNRHGEQRDTTTTPIQQLFFLNSPFLQKNAAGLAARTELADPAERVRSLYRRVLLREPTAVEEARSLALVRESGGETDASAWSLLAQALLISNEFLFVD